METFYYMVLSFKGINYFEKVYFLSPIHPLKIVKDLREASTIGGMKINVDFWSEVSGGEIEKNNITSDFSMDELVSFVRGGIF